MDRLSALMSRFELEVRPGEHGANFQILSGSLEDDTPALLRFGAAGPLSQPTNRVSLFSAHINWGGPDNPLLGALPQMAEQVLTQDSDTRSVATLLISEDRATRCGAASVLNRLCEVLMVRLLRQQIEQGGVSTGLLGGLADPRLARAIVAMHDRPETPWQTSTLAREAGLSVSHFSELFRHAVGETPLAYLRRWRLALARQDLARGHRVKAVAARYCYRSAEALSRAVSQAYGMGPMQIRKLGI